MFLLSLFTSVTYRATVRACRWEDHVCHLEISRTESKQSPRDTTWKKPDTGGNLNSEVRLAFLVCPHDLGLTLPPLPHSPEAGGAPEGTRAQRPERVQTAWAQHQGKRVLSNVLPIAISAQMVFLKTACTLACAFNATL